MKLIVFLNFLLMYNLLFMRYDERLSHHVIIYLFNYTVTFIVLYKDMRSLNHRQFLMLYFMNMVCTSYLDISYAELYNEIDNWCHINIMTFAIYSVVMIRNWCRNICKTVMVSIEEDVYKI